MWNTCKYNGNCKFPGNNSIVLSCLMSEIPDFTTGADESLMYGMWY
jgi:hypothetical protein